MGLKLVETFITGAGNNKKNEEPCYSFLTSEQVNKKIYLICSMHLHPKTIMPSSYFNKVVAFQPEYGNKKI